ncbi:MAG: DinB family protein [Pirellulales bacterium]
MFERELTLYQFNLDYLKVLVGDLDDSALHARPYAGGNPPVWILGHLAVSTDYAARMLGLRPACPKEWHQQFGPGSKPDAIAQPAPSKGDLVSAIETGCRRVMEAAPNASAEFMNQPHAVELLKTTVLKTNGDVLAHLMTTHTSFHMAQLSACRRASGKAPFV